MRDDKGHPIDVVSLEPEQISAFYDEDREQRDLVVMAEVPDHLVGAIYAIEDRRFEEHNGVDLRAFAVPRYRECLQEIEGLATNAAPWIMGEHPGALDAYALAVRERFRFYSFGDGMLIL